KLITCIEDFSNELFYEIFDYFDAFELYETFSNLNIRFQYLLDSNIVRLKINFSSLILSDFGYRFINIIYSNRQRIVSLSLFDTSITNAFFSWIILDLSFHRLEYLFIFGLNSYKLLPFLLSLIILPRLFSLTIYIDENIGDLSEAYRIIFSLPVLKYNKLSFEIDETYVPLSIVTHYDFSYLQYLILDHSCTLYVLTSMLSCTPQLYYLYCGFLHESNQCIQNDIKITLSNLISITIGRCYVQFDEFEIFIRKISSQLQILRITTSNDTAYLDGDRWEQLFTEYIPNLRKFEFKHHEFIEDNFEFTIHHALIHRFTSSFWIKRHWFIELIIDILDWSGIEIIYSIHPYRKYWYELNEFEKNYSYSIQQSQSIVFTILDRFYIDWKDFFISDFSPIFNTLKITHLVMECQNIFIGTLIELLQFLPNLDSLKICSLSLVKPRCLYKEEVEILHSISKNNKITKVNIERTSELAEVQFLIDLCPHMQYFESSCSSAQNSARENPSIYESITDLKMEQHANLITAEQLQAGHVKVRKRVKYEHLDEQLQQLASTFHLITRDLYFKRARALFNF
ncbi:unnamed protein product, partial [Rotaria sp. Silwood2]